MKKRTLAFMVAAVACCVALVGGTLAYFTDNDVETNVFTAGNVDIDLVEEFDAEAAKLMAPGKEIKKVVTVKNTGSLESYVRVHIALPAILDSGAEDQPQFAAYNNTLHFNFPKGSTADGLWSWGKSADAANYPENGGAWNCYPATINGIQYNVYVVTYETALAAETGVTEAAAMDQVYLDTKVTQEGMAEILTALGGDVKVLVAAEGCQVETFDNAFDALNTAFGVPGTYTVKWTVA